MIEVKIQRIGDSFGIILPDDFLRRMGSSEGTSLFLVEGAGRDYRLVPAESDLGKTMAAAADIMERYDDALRELAK